MKISVTRILSSLDNERGLTPLLVKDVIDNIGRTTMEYKRGGKDAHHAGRERGIEEVLTTAVWIGGRKFLNFILLDPIMKLRGLDPEVDIRLLKQSVQPMPAFLKSATQVSRYMKANVVRFAVGTLIPIGIIALGIPTFNQHLTNQKKRKELALQRAQALTIGSVPYVQGTRNFVRGQGLNPAFVPAQMAHFKQPHARFGEDPAVSPSQMAHFKQPHARFGEDPAVSPSQMAHFKGTKQDVRFGGGMGNVVSNLLTNDFWGNVVVDLGISGGRLYKESKRDKIAMLETGIREASIIAFLYYAGDKVKTFIRHHLFDKKFGTISDLTFDSTKWLKEQGPKIAHSNAWNENLEFLNTIGKKLDAPKKNLKQKLVEAWNDLRGVKPPIDLHAEKAEKKLLEILKDSLSKTEKGVFVGNPVSELMFKQGHLPVINITELSKLEHKLLSTEIKALKAIQPDAKFMLDPRKYIDMSALVKDLKLAEKLKNTPDLMKTLTKTGRFKFLAILSGILVSTGFIAWLSPMFQHWLTFKLTGKKDFPGTRHIHLDPLTSPYPQMLHKQNDKPVYWRAAGSFQPQAPAKAPFILAGNPAFQQPYGVN